MISPRSLAAGLLPQGAPLYRDRGDALYVTRALGAAWRGELPGFWVQLRGDWAYLYPRCALAEICGFRPDDLASRLQRFSGESPQAQRMLAGCIKAMEQPLPAEIARWEKRLRQSAAEGMRTGGGAGLYACALALAEAKRSLHFGKETSL